MDYANPAGYANRSLIRTRPDQTTEKQSVVNELLIASFMYSMLYLTAAYAGNVYSLLVGSALIGFVFPEFGFALLMYYFFLGLGTLDAYRLVYLIPYVTGRDVIAMSIIARMVFNAYRYSSFKMFEKSLINIFILVLPFAYIVIVQQLFSFFSEREKLLSVYQFFKTLGFIIICGSMLFQDMKAIKKTLVCLFLVSVISSYIIISDNLFSLGSYQEEVRIHYVNEVRLPPIAIARMASIGALIGIYIFFLEKHSLIRLMIVPGVLLLLMTCIFANERGPVVALVLTSVYFASIFSEKYRRTKLRTVFVISLLLIAVYYLIIFMSSIGNVRLLSFMKYGLDAVSGDTARLEWARIGIRMFFNHPIFGNGLKGFSAAETGAMNPHNMYVEYLHSGGVVGLLLIIPFIKLVIVSWRSVQHNTMITLLKSLVVFGLISGFVSSFTYSVEMYLGICGLVSIYAQKRIRAGSSDNHRVVLK